MRQLSVRVPEVSHRQVRALSTLFNASQAEIVTQAIGWFIQCLPMSRRRALKRLMRAEKPFE